jgi:hypothetical protein
LKQFKFGAVLKSNSMSNPPVSPFSLSLYRRVPRVSQSHSSTPSPPFLFARSNHCYFHRTTRRRRMTRGRRAVAFKALQHSPPYSIHFQPSSPPSKSSSVAPPPFPTEQAPTSCPFSSPELPNRCPSRLDPQLLRQQHRSGFRHPRHLVRAGLPSSIKLQAMMLLFPVATSASAEPPPPPSSPLHEP